MSSSLVKVISGKKGVEIRDDGFGLELFTCRNGYQWSGFDVDGELLDMIKKAIIEYEVKRGTGQL